MIADPFPGNVIPQSRAESRPQSPLQDWFRAPNFGAPGALARNFFYQPAQFSNTDQGDIRVDQTFRRRTISTRASRSARMRNRRSATSPGFIGGGTSSHGQHRAGGDLGHSYLHADAGERISLRLRPAQRQYSSAAGRTAWASRCKTTWRSFPAPVLGFPSIAFNYSGQLSGTSEFTGWGGGDPNLNVENRFQWADNLSWTHGQHAFKFGADIRRAALRHLKGTPFFGQDIYGATFTSSSNAPGSGLPLADFLLGYPSFIQGTPMLDWGRQRSIYVGGFVQDDWKISQRLTLNFGLRYELFTQPVDARDLGSLFNVQTGQYALPGQERLLAARSSMATTITSGRARASPGRRRRNW